MTVTNILSIDVLSKKGVVDYSFSDNKYCGETTIFNSSEYILCISNIGARTYALRLDPSKETGFYVDKAINNLAKETYINSISVDRNYLYIIPDYGRPRFSEVIGEFTIDESITKDINAQISKNSEVIKLKEKGYNVINSEGGSF